MRLLALLSLVQTVFCFSSAPYRRKTGTHFERLSIFSANRNRSFRYRQSRLLVPISAPPSSKSDETPQSLASFRSRIKAMVPPSHERRKIVPLCIMFFLIISNYTILRSTKDVLLITAPNSGAEVIPFIKTYVNLPAAIGFTALYMKLTDWLKYENVFYACVIPFLVFYAAFATLIYPNHALLHPALAGVGSWMPHQPLAIVRNWSFSLFYVMAELWGSVVAALSFWGIANDVFTVSEAKKYYPIFGLGANVALIVSGQYVKWVSARQATLGHGVEAFTVALRYLMGAVVASGCVMLGTYRHLRGNSKSSEGINGMTKKKDKPSIMESLCFLRSRKYIRDLSVLVIASGLSLNLVDVSWKTMLKKQFPDPNAYAAYMGNFSSLTGVCSLLTMLVGRYVFQRFGWRTAALVAPTVMGTTGLSFFGLVMFPQLGAPFARLFRTTPVMLAVVVGAAQSILSKSAKYSLFDPCKEMAYIPLDQESKTKGKAAIDVIGTPLGKSGSSLLQQILIVSCGSLTAAIPYLSVALAGVIWIWLRASQSLADQLEAKMIDESKQATRTRK